MIIQNFYGKIYYSHSHVTFSPNPEISVDVYLGMERYCTLFVTSVKRIFDVFLTPLVTLCNCSGVDSVTQTRIHRTIYIYSYIKCQNAVLVQVMAWAWAAASGVQRRTWRACVHRASTRARAPRRSARRRRSSRARSTSCSTPRSGTRCARNRSPCSSASCLSFSFLLDWLCSIFLIQTMIYEGIVGNGTGRGSFCWYVERLTVLRTFYEQPPGAWRISIQAPATSLSPFHSETVGLRPHQSRDSTLT